MGRVLIWHEFSICCDSTAHIYEQERRIRSFKESESESPKVPGTRGPGVGYCQITVMPGEVLSPPDEEQVALIVYVPNGALAPHGTGPLSAFDPVIVNRDEERGDLGVGDGCGVEPAM